MTQLTGDPKKQHEVQGIRKYLERRATQEHIQYGVAI